MITLFIKLILYKLFKLLGFPNILPVSYTLSVTDKCNSSCKTCNIHQKKTNELSLQEYEAIFKDIGRSPYWVTISGGEPFLRKDLTDILILLRRYCRPRMINIPTNGILTKKIVETVKRICNELPDTRIVINLSIDGIGKEHDNIRNVPDNYRKAVDTYKGLRRLKNDNLSIGIHSVISTFNVDNFSTIMQTLMELNPDSYITEIAEERNEMNNFDKGITPEPLQYRAAIDALLHDIKNTKYKGMNRVTQAFRVEYYNLVKKVLRDEKEIIPCYAGIASCQIAADGEVWFCCIEAEPIGKIQVGRYSFREIWFSQTAKKKRKSIRQKKCFCPLANAAYTNMMLNFPTLVRVFYRSYIKWY